jgi:hypothetical protein
MRDSRVGCSRVPYDLVDSRGPDLDVKGKFIGTTEIISINRGLRHEKNPY